MADIDITKKGVVKKKTDELIPYARNARTHSAAQVSQIASSIREFGFNNPVLIDSKDGIIAGHGRVMAAQKLGLKEVPCIMLDHLSDTQRRAYILADNKIALNSEWDEDMLAVELEELEIEGYELELLGFGVDEELKEIAPNENKGGPENINRGDGSIRSFVFTVTDRQYEECQKILSEYIDKNHLSTNAEAFLGIMGVDK